MRLSEEIRNELRTWLDRFPHVNGFSEEDMEEITDGEYTGRRAIRVYVTHKHPKYALRPEDTLPDELFGFPVDVVEIGEVRAFSSNFPLQDPTKRYRPLMGGISVGHYAITAGTLSYFVKDASGQVGILSNNHVLANENNASIGDPILQPGPYDGGQNPADEVATLTKFIKIEYASPSTCLNGQWVSGVFNGLAKLLNRKTRLQSVVPRSLAVTNQVDCAYALLTDQANYQKVINGLFLPSGVGDFAVNDIVTKSGRTTKVTQGIITDTAATVEVGYGGANVAIFSGQYIVSDQNTPFSQGGDSGSLVLRLSDGVAGGLLFAGGNGTTILNHLPLVLSSLGVTLLL